METIIPPTTEGVRITFDLTLDRPITAEILQAIEALAETMQVQGEDGVFVGGHADAEPVDIDGHDVPNDHVADITSSVFTITPVRTWTLTLSEA